MGLQTDRILGPRRRIVARHAPGCLPLFARRPIRATAILSRQGGLHHARRTGWRDFPYLCRLQGRHLRPKSIKGAEVEDIFPDHAGRVWIAMRRDEDLYGRLYVGIGRGLDRLNPSGLNRTLHHRRDSTAIRFRLDQFSSCREAQLPVHAEKRRNRLAHHRIAHGQLRQPAASLLSLPGARGGFLRRRSAS